jgi:hypothetical protein
MIWQPWLTGAMVSNMGYQLMSLKFRHVLLALLPLVVAGCVTAEEVDQDKCSSFGFRPGTDAFASCMMQQSARHDDEERRYMDGLHERQEREREKERRRREERQIDTRPQFDKDGNPNFDTQGDYIGCHGAGCQVDDPDADN